MSKLPFFLYFLISIIHLIILCIVLYAIYNCRDISCSYAGFILIFSIPAHIVINFIYFILFLLLGKLENPVYRLFRKGLQYLNIYLLFSIVVGFASGYLFSRYSGYFESAFFMSYPFIPFALCIIVIHKAVTLESNKSN